MLDYLQIDQIGELATAWLAINCIINFPNPHTFPILSFVIVPPITSCSHAQYQVPNRLRDDDTHETTSKQDIAT